MKIAQISPLYESVPPKLYGGTERVVSYLTEELVRQGHDVTLFASGDSKTNAKLVSLTEDALRLKDVQDPLAHHIAQMQEVIEHAHEFDVMHFHTDYLHFPFSSLLNKPHLTTLHGRLDIPDLVYVYHKFKKQPLVSISDSQRKGMPVDVNWIGTVYHGLPLDLYRKGEGDGDYVAFIGRISPEKRPDRAIQIAKEAGIKIKIAAKIDTADEDYYQRMIKQLMEQPHVEFIGEIGEDRKGEFLGKAKALLFPIDWPEPFGMVMIEAMACGTPVIAYNHGSVPEVIDKGESGFIVDNVAESVRALENIDLIDRNKVRETFEKRFSTGVMARNYMELYQSLIPSTKKLVFISKELKNQVRSLS
ncbi:glycosyltransferase family 4 protein [Fulvivirga kasyanovii]|uniref:Glycosyltransferase family 4 protein n=1 Tax=Fulvivirga kasyanovii TaxID=396812 RepID=A0ABW9RT84_9BACT|nr:glycosyltransferase family 4 protein [Fulvivirga kasyanovii]MTI27111.1 glycosyltransferase family 4 protein [Fulvivirga kasyanovii]